MLDNVEAITAKRATTKVALAQVIKQWAVSRMGLRSPFHLVRNRPAVYPSTAAENHCMTISAKPTQGGRQSRRDSDSEDCTGINGRPAHRRAAGSGEAPVG